MGITVFRLKYSAILIKQEKAIFVREATWLSWMADATSSLNFLSGEIQQRFSCGSFFFFFNALPLYHPHGSFSFVELAAFGKLFSLIRMVSGAKDKD